MSLPTAADGNAAMMTAGMQMLQAPEFLQQIAAGMPVLSDDDDQPSIEELLRQANEERLAGIQSLFEQYGQSGATPLDANAAAVQSMTSDEAYTQQPNLMLNDSAISKYGAATTLAPLLMGMSTGTPVTALGLGALGIYDKFVNQNPKINERLKQLDPDFDENSYFNQMMQSGGFGGFLNEGGSVGRLDVGKTPDSSYLKYGDENAYILGEKFGDENPTYDYTLGMNLSDIMPGLSLQLGVREDEIQEPMMSPDDEKFFKLLYNF